jgi:hypothetical protein
MKRVWLLPVVLSFAGCGGASTTGLLDGGGDAAGRGDTSASDGATDTAADAGRDVAGDAGPVAITISPSCPEFTPCGGDVVGTWTPTGGCVNDPLATSKSLCPALVVNSETAEVEGSVTFTDSLVTRNYTSRYAMDVTIPASCLTIDDCAKIEAAYQAYIPDTSCKDVAAGACRCTGSISSSATEGSTYTVNNDQITTGTGDNYAYCVTGSTLAYRHTSGPSAEIGSYTLQKQ